MSRLFWPLLEPGGFIGARIYLTAQLFQKRFMGTIDLLSKIAILRLGPLLHMKLPDQQARS